LKESVVVGKAKSRDVGGEVERSEWGRRRDLNVARISAWEGRCSLNVSR
jgi:hypothetical protein